MTVRTRKDPKTGKNQYKARYSFKTPDGIRHDAETGWFPTEKKAREEAYRLQYLKENTDFYDHESNRNRLVSSVFEDFIKDLKEKDKTELEITKFKVYYDTASAIRNKHMPNDILRLKISELKPRSFRYWLKELNDKKTIGGKYIRMCNLVLGMFNSYLDKNGYYLDEDQEAKTKAQLKLVPLKSTKANNKEAADKRHWLKIDEFFKLVNWYDSKGLHEFPNFYWYTLFHVLYFSGMRVEELVGLKWQCVYFVDKNSDYDKPYISIEDSISRLEGDEKVYERQAQGLKKTKNDNSVRNIPIIHAYYELLIDYRDAYRYYFNKDIADLDECFVFPNLAQNNPKAYQKHDNIAKALKKATEACNLPKTDAQMFRHACGYLFIDEYPNGLGFNPSELFRYFGHHSEKMLDEIYTKLNKEQSHRKLEINLGNLVPEIKRDKNELTLEEKRAKILDDIRNNNMGSYETRKRRIFGQIDFVSENTARTEYFYMAKDQQIIDEYIAEHPDITIKFTIDEEVI